MWKKSIALIKNGYFKNWSFFVESKMVLQWHHCMWKHPFGTYIYIVLCHRFLFFLSSGILREFSYSQRLKKSLQKCWGIARRLCLIATPPGVQVWLCKYNSRVWCWRRVHFHWLVGLCVLYDWDSSGFSSVRTGYTGLKESRASESLSSIERDIFRSASCLHCSCQRLMEQKWSAGV